MGIQRALSIILFIGHLHVTDARLAEEVLPEFSLSVAQRTAYNFVMKVWMASSSPRTTIGEQVYGFDSKIPLGNIFMWTLGIRRWGWTRTNVYKLLRGHVVVQVDLSSSVSRIKPLLSRSHLLLQRRPSSSLMKFPNTSI